MVKHSPKILANKEKATTTTVSELCQQNYICNFVTLIEHIGGCCTWVVG